MTASTFGRGNAGNITINARSAAFSGIGSNGQSSGAFSNVLLTGEGNGGRITVNADSLLATDGAQLLTNTVGRGNAGDIIATVDVLTIATGAQLNASSRGLGNAGTIIVSANTIQLDGTASNNLTGIQTQLLPGAIGNAGQINLTTGSLSVRNGAVLTASTAGQGNAGNLVIQAREAVIVAGVDDDGLPSRLIAGVNLPAVGNGGTVDITAQSITVADGAFLSTGNSFGQGNGGSITLKATDQVRFDRGDVRLATSVGAIGNGGVLNITAPTIALVNESVINADTAGQGNAGMVQFRANQVVGDRSAITTSVASEGVGNGGTIDLQAETITLNNTLLFANTAGVGNAGTIMLQAPQSILLDNTSVLDSSVLLNGAGSGGTVTLTTNLLTLNNQSLLSSLSGGQGAAGNIQVQAENLRMSNGASIATVSTTGNGGNIVLTIADSIILQNNSDITATALGDGDGGRLTITAGGFILARLEEDSDIFANAVTGAGGKIFARATGIYGFRLYEGVNTPQSDFFADSRSGLDGVIEIQTAPEPGLNPQGLPVFDSSDEIAQTCRPGSATTSSFVTTGRGGLPPSPGEIVVGGNTLWEDVEPRFGTSALPPNPSGSAPSAGTTEVASSSSIELLGCQR